MPRRPGLSILKRMQDERLRCAICGDVIGVYEPMVVLDGSQLRQTSWLNEPTLSTDHVITHHGCALDSQPPDAHL